MKKKILAFALAVILVLSCCMLAACSDDTKLPPSGTDGSGNGTTKPDNSGSDDKKDPPTTSGGDETNADGLLLEYFDNYVPNSDAKYTGKVGVGGTGASFDKLSVRIGTKVAYENDFDSSSDLPEGVFSVYGGALSDWSVADDTVTAGNKKLAYGGGDSILTLGNTAWGPYRFITSILLEEGGHADLYFCVKDENNYYKVSVSTTAEEGISLVEVKDGKETQISKFALAHSAGTWIPTSVNINKDDIVVYINGDELFRISEDMEAHVYTGYLGFGQWNTELYFDNVVVENMETGEVYYTQDFEDGTFLDTAVFGIRNNADWSIANSSDWEIVELEDGNHVLHFKSTSVRGAAILFDAHLPEGCTSYRFTYEGYVVAGGEGPQCVFEWNIGTMAESTHEGKDYICFDVGGWSGQSAMQEIIGGVKNNIQNNAPIGLLTQTWQKVEVQAYPEVVFGYFDGNFVQAYWW